METLNEDVEEYSWREVILPSLIPVVAEPELERETVERRRGRVIIIAVDHGPNSKHAFDWALAHLCRLADTIHLVHAVSSVSNEIVYEKSKELMEELSVEAFQVCLVKTVARIVEGHAGKAICKEADKIKPAAVVMGTRGRSLIQRCLYHLTPTQLKIGHTHTHRERIHGTPVLSTPFAFEFAPLDLFDG